MSQVHNKLNNTHLALMHYSWAMDLDPKVFRKLMCSLCDYNHFQGANSQVKDALDPALNRVGQELGWDILLCLFLSFVFFPHGRLCCGYLTKNVQAFNRGGRQGGANGVWRRPSWRFPGDTHGGEGVLHQVFIPRGRLVRDSSRLRLRKICTALTLFQRFSPFQLP